MAPLLSITSIQTLASLIGLPLYAAALSFYLSLGQPSAYPTGESVTYGFIMANMEVYLLPISIFILYCIIQWRLGKRAVGITKMKRDFSKATSIPTYRAGLERKIGKAIINSIIGKKK